MKFLTKLGLVPASLLLLGLGLFIAGCNTKTHQRPAPHLPDAPSIISKHEKKDRDILGAAHEAESIAPEVGPQVRVIEQAVASAPADDIKKASAAYEEIIKKLTARAEAAEKRALEAEDKFSRWVRGGLFVLGALVFAAGIAVAVLGSKVPMFGPVAGVAVSSGGAGIFSMAIVYDFVVKHPYVSLASVLTAFSVAGFLFVRNHKKGL